jgi:hypothetical protein
MIMNGIKGLTTRRPPSKCDVWVGFPNPDSQRAKQKFVSTGGCLATCSQLLTKPVLHKLRSSTSFSNFQYPIVSLRTANSCLHLPPSLHLTFILPSTSLSKTCLRRPFLRKKRPIQLAFLPFTVCATFLSFWTLCKTSFFTRSVQLIVLSYLKQTENLIKCQS